MLGSSPRERELGRIRQLLAGLLVETRLIRLSRSLARKYSPDQPRAPAGQPDGGRWVAEGGGAGEQTDILAIPGPGRWTSLASEDEATGTGLSRERTLLEDGSEVLTIRIHAGPRAGDEEHTVTGPDGGSRVFETSGDTQTIRDGITGEILSHSIFTATGAEPVAAVQPAFLPALPAAFTTTVELAGLLFAVLSARREGFGPVLGLSAQEFRPAVNDGAAPAVWVGSIGIDELNRACPRAEEIQTETDRVAQRLRRSGLRLTPQEFGNLLHYDLADFFNAKEDPNLRAEVSGGQSWRSDIR